MSESIEISTVLPARAERIFHAWLDSDEHAAFTGDIAAIDASPGGAFTLWNGYITGRTLQLEPGRRIIQTWRTTEFPAAADDSLLEIVLDELPEGTRLTLLHTQIPEGQGARYQDGWLEHYFTRMAAYFNRPETRAEPPVTTATRPPSPPTKATSKPKHARSARGGSAAAEKKPGAAAKKAAAKKPSKRAVKPAAREAGKTAPKKTGKTAQKKAGKAAPKMAAKKAAKMKRKAAGKKGTA